MTTLHLSPAMPLHGEVDRQEATWVGLLEAERLTASTDLLLLDGGERFDRARLLVRDDTGIRGYVAVALADGAADPALVREAVAALPPVAVRLPEPAPVAVTVVVCTRERPETLRETLRSLGALEADDLEVVVVDNAPTTPRTAELVAREFPDFRYVREDAAGLSHARNAGLHAATSTIVAFTDDDVIVDSRWVRSIVAGFSVGDDVGCVTGAVPSGELRNAVQSYFDARVSWSGLIVPRVFRLSEPPADLPMFPFCVGEFGTGANFAVRRDTMLGLGGFDTALGAGTGTQGGEDLDMFLRILYADAAIVVAPAAVVWHRHRADLAALTAQAIGYGRGFGAWATTVVLDPRMLGAAVRRSPRALARLLCKPMTTVDDAAARPASAADRAVARQELRSILSGPASYLRESRQQRETGVYAGPPSRGQALERRLWAAVAGAAGALGLVAALPLPTGLSLALLACFVLVGPGAVVRAWVPLSPPLTSLAVPALGLTAMILAVTASAFAAWWEPSLLLAAISAVTLAGAAATFRAGVRT